MAETYKRGGVWYARYIDKDNEPRRTSLKVRVGVENEAALVQSALADLLSGQGGAGGRAASRRGPTLQDVYDKALRSHWKSVKDVRGVESRWEQVRDYFRSDTPIASLTASKIADFKAHLFARGDHPKTVNRKLALVSKLLHLAAEWGMLDKLPVIKRERESQGRIRWLSHAEESTAVATLRASTRPHASDMADLVEFLVDTGLRLSEALNAQDKDFALDAMPRPRVTVWVSKGGKPRTVPLTARARVIVSARLRREKDRDEKQRGTSRPFAGLTQDVCGHLWADTRKAMGLELDTQFVIHALRHTFAVRMVEAGVDVTVIKDLMGHSKVETTMIYAHVSGRTAADAIARLEAVREAVPEAAPNLQVVGQR